MHLVNVVGVSALWPLSNSHVHYWKAEVPLALTNVCFWGNKGHRAASRHGHYQFAVTQVQWSHHCP